MSLDFIKMISDLKERRHFIAMNRLAVTKTPCAILFVPNVPDCARQIVDNLKSIINLTCICVLSNDHKEFFSCR